VGDLAACETVLDRKKWAGFSGTPSLALTWWVGFGGVDNLWITSSLMWITFR